MKGNKMLPVLVLSLLVGTVVANCGTMCASCTETTCLECPYQYGPAPTGTDCIPCGNGCLQCSATTCLECIGDHGPDTTGTDCLPVVKGVPHVRQLSV